MKKISLLFLSAALVFVVMGYSSAFAYNAGGGNNLGGAFSGTINNIGSSGIEGVFAQLASQKKGVVMWQDNDSSNLHDVQFGIVNVAAVPAIWTNSNAVFEGKSGGVVEFELRDSSGSPIGEIEVSKNSDGTVKVVTEDFSLPSGSNVVSELNLTVYDYATFMSMFGKNSKAQEDARTNIIRQSAALTNKIISTRILNTFSPKPKVIKTIGSSQSAVPYAELERGMASGDTMDGVGVWGMGAFSTSNISQTGQKSDGNVGLALAGFDKVFLNERLLAGVALGYENSWSKINSTGKSTDGNGFTVNPYVAYRVTDQLLLKGNLGATFSSYSPDDSKDFKGNRWLGDIGAEYTWLKGAWLLSGEIGTAYVSESFTEDYDRVYLWTGRVGGRVGYAVNDSTLPYMRLVYNQDLTSSFSDDIGKQDFEVGLGANFYKNNWTVSLEGFGNFFRTSQETFGGSLLIRYDF